jgi:hypothetical protein
LRTMESTTGVKSDDGFMCHTHLSLWE